MHDIVTYEQVAPVPKPQHVEKIEPALADPQGEAAKQALDAASVIAPPKVDYATDLFNMLSMDGPSDGPSENGLEAASPDDNAWAGFQCMSPLTTCFHLLDHQSSIVSFVPLFANMVFALTLRLRAMVVILFMVAAAEEASTAEKTGPTKPVESSPQSTSGIEDLFKDSPSVLPSVSEKPKKDVKNDIMSLFEKVYAT